MNTIGQRPQHTIGVRVRDVARRRAEEALAEVPGMFRALRRLFLVLAITVPLVAVGLFALAWHAIH